MTVNTTAFFLAQRILFAHVYQKSISTMTIICFMGIFIGSFSLALVSAIMNGFEVAIHAKMQGIHSNVIIQSYKSTINLEVLGSVLQKEFPEITAVSPMATHHILLRTDDSSEDMPIVAVIKGIDPETEQLTSSLSKKIINSLPSTEYSQLFNNNHIIIGKQLARNNQIAVGDTIELLFIRNERVHSKHITFDSQSAVISGIFDTGIDEFDSGVVYCSLSFLEELYPNIAIDQVNIALTTQCDENNVIHRLRNRLGLDVYSWKDLYPSLVASLKLEKYVSFFILALILLVASMNIISLLFMQITQKRPDIALLKAIGMSHHAISTIFFIIGMTISCSASFFGLVGALIVSWLLQKYPFITLPDTYYVTHLPVAMSWEIICAVFCVVVILSLFATWLPIQRIRSINVSRVLRFEG
jgi:lipoprotein-releasing system permease protein